MDIELDNSSSTEAKKKIDLLVECIKYHLDDDVCLRKSLLEIASIAASNSFVKDYIRVNGTLKFIMNIFTSNDSVHIKEATMFCLACAIDQNVCSQKSMTTTFIFENLSGILLCDINRSGLLHTAAYLISCITNNNSYGQMICRKTSCLKNLLSLFRLITNRKTSERDVLKNVIVKHVELLINVCNAISTCVNNPRNSENQEYCARHVFNLSLQFIQQCQHMIAVQSIIKLIAVLAASSEKNQDLFREMNGIDVLVQALKTFTLATSNVYNADYLNTAVLLTSALDTCLLDNSTNAELFGNHGGIEILVKLLHLCHNDTPNQIQTILAIAHATDHSGMNQRRLLDCGGLVVMVNLFIETSDNMELQTVLKYVLHVCVPDGSTPIFTKENNENDSQTNDSALQASEVTEIFSEKLDKILQKLTQIEHSRIESASSRPTSRKQFRSSSRGSKGKQNDSYLKKSENSVTKNLKSHFSGSKDYFKNYFRPNIPVVESLNLNNIAQSPFQHHKKQIHNQNKKVIVSESETVDGSTVSPLNKRCLITATSPNRFRTQSNSLYRNAAHTECTEASSSEIDVKPPSTNSNNHACFDKNKSQNGHAISSKKHSNSPQEMHPVSDEVLLSSNLEQVSSSKENENGIWATSNELSNPKGKTSQIPTKTSQIPMPCTTRLNSIECCCNLNIGKQCPAGNPPSSMAHQLPLTSRNYNVSLAFVQNTCYFHQKLREIECDFIKSNQHPERARNDNVHSPLESPVDQPNEHKSFSAQIP